MKNYLEITSNDPVALTWKYLRKFLNIEDVSQWIRNIHDIPEGKFRDDVSKQAKQIGYCIRQAEEFFRASSQVTSATKPILLYYGLVSLSQVVILLFNDGNSSLDVRRKQKSSSHHGLDLNKDILNYPKGLLPIDVFFERMKCCLYVPAGEPKGQFSVFYQALDPGFFRIEATTRFRGESRYSGFFRNHSLIFDCCNKKPLSDLIGQSVAILGLLKSLPDLYNPLDELRIQPDICPGKLEIRFIEHFQKKKDSGEEFLTKKVEKDICFIYSVQPSQKQGFYDYYKQFPDIKFSADFGKTLQLTQEIISLPNEDGIIEEPQIYFPDIVDDIYVRV